MIDVADALVGVGIIINSDSMPGVLMLDKDYNNMSKFLNRILGMPVELQNRLFKYFTDTLQAIISQAKKAGRFDLGILGQLFQVFFITNQYVISNKIVQPVYKLYKCMTATQALFIKVHEILGP